MIEKKRHYIKPLTRVRSIQQALPKAKLHGSGMLEFPGNIFSMCYRLKDVDFAAGSVEEQKAFFQEYSDILNSLDGQGCTYKITLCKRSINHQVIDYLLLPTNVEDGFDHFRVEYNSIRRHNQLASGGLIQEKYITVNTERKNAALAEEIFATFESEFGERLKSIDSGITAIDADERMRIFHDFYRVGQEPYYNFSYEKAKERRSPWRDYVCPDKLKFRDFDFDVHRKVGRVLFIKDWGGGLRVLTLAKLMELQTNMMISMDIIPLSNESTAKYMQDVEMASEANLDRWQRRPGAGDRKYTQPPIRIKKDQEIVNTYAYDVNERNQKLFYTNVTIVILADTLEQLNEYTDSLISVGAYCGCQISTLGFQQMDGVNTVLPYGPRYIQNLRTVTTENQAALIPFNFVAIHHPTGIPYGVHSDSRQEILIDRRLLVNGNEWILGVPGSGKSFLVKLISFMEALLTDGDIIFIDPHGEYTHITEALGGQVVSLGGGSGHIINAMDMCLGYGDGDDIKKKMELLVAVFHAALGYEFTKSMEAILMRCCQRIYLKYVNGGYQYIPTIQDLHQEILNQPEEVAKQLALLMEPMLIGAMSCFNGYTNVDIYNRFVCFDISRMEKTMHDAGMTVIMDAIRNRLIMNAARKVPTYVKIDEAGRFLDDMYLSRLFESFYSEMRKFGGYISGIVQNVNKLLHTEAGRNMLSNSEIVVMLRQSEYDAAELEQLFGLSDIQKKKLIQAEGGEGLIKSGTQFIMYDGRIEKGYIYDLADTKPKHSYA